MNPFMMSNVFFGPMGMSISPMCFSGVNMPYYGMNDSLTFMNFPIFRNTSSDFLLDPRLALMQSQQSMMNGGSIFGNNFLPLFNNFPGMSPIAPWLNTKPETEEEKKAREEREAEAKKPEAKKADSLKKSFDNIKKLGESKNLVTLDESIVKKADEAMKKDKAADRLAAMKEVMALIPDDVIRKSVMADDTVVKKLKEAGYNFNYENNKYSLPDSGIENVKMNQVHDNIVSKKNYDAQGLASFAAAASADTILTLVSTWNNTQKEKGILKYISQNMPTEIGPKKQLTQIVPQIVNALIDKADQYSGSPKIKAERDKLAAAKEDLLSKFNADNLIKVSNAFETLYARLRMQEAVKVRDYIVNNTDFSSLNDVKDGLINNNMVVAETYENLKKEGISNVPAEASLDKIQTVSTVVVNDQGVVDKDKEYENNPKGLVEEYLAKDNKYLTKVEGTDVYKTKAYDGKGSGVKYYSVQNNKLVEVTKKQDGTFVASAGAKAVTAKEIEAYDSSVKRIEKLLNAKSIVPVEKTTNLFKATGADEYYALIGDKFGKVKTTADSITLEELTADDLEDFDDDKVKSKELVEKSEKEKEAKEKQNKITSVVKKVTADKYAFKTLNSNLDSLGLEATGVLGYYKTKSEPNLYFKYDQTTQKLKHLSKVTKINDDGTMIESGTKKSCAEVQSPENSSKDLQKILYTSAYNRDDYKKHKTEEQIKNDLNTIRRKMNSFKSLASVSDLVTFIKTFEDEAYHWWKSNDPSLCSAISKNRIIPEDEKKAFIKLIATKVKQIIDVKHITFDDPDDKVNLEHIANGKMYNNGSSLTLASTAEELDRLIALFLKKYNG